MDVAAFHAARRFADTAYGRIAYIDQGSGPPVIFLHGVPLNGFHWRFMIAGLQKSRRCIALDLMGLGYTEIGPKHDVSFTAQAQMVAEFLDALGLDKVDVVSNDSGGAVAQIFAANHPHRVRTLTLSNCDVHDNWPPESIAPSMEAAGKGTLIDNYAQFMDDRAGRNARFTRAWADPTVLTDEIYGAYIAPLMATAQNRDNFHRYWLAFDNRQTVSIEDKLKQLRVPTLIIWAMDDIFFDVAWAYWLKDTIPGAVRVVEVKDAKLFFPEDRPEAFLAPLVPFLDEYSPARPPGLR
jgi:pimeloyl-ACP methyl ester carboxylesterase